MGRKSRRGPRAGSKSRCSRRCSSAASRRISTGRRATGWSISSGPCPAIRRGGFRLTEVFELPFVCGDAEATSQALTHFHREWLRDEYKDTRPLVFHTAAPGHIHTAGRQIRTLEDLKGVKMRAPSRASAAMLKALGATPVGMPVAEGLRGALKGRGGRRLAPVTIMRPFRLHEVTKHHTEVSLSCVLFLMTMNKARYDGLPAKVRTIIDEPRESRWPDGSAGCGRTMKSPAARSPGSGATRSFRSPKRNASAGGRPPGR